MCICAAMGSISVGMEERYTIFISRIQSPTTSASTRSYSHDKYIKIVRVCFFKPNSGPETTHSALSIRFSPR